MIINYKKANHFSKKIHDQFNEALKERNKRGHYAEITFIGVNSAKLKSIKKWQNILNVTVDFVAEVITCIKDKDKKIVSGDPEKIKKFMILGFFQETQNQTTQIGSL